jgi:hypothetical protein
MRRGVRDSTDPTGAILIVPNAAMRAFTADIKAGGFKDLLGGH